MRIAFMGTPPFAAQCLTALHEAGQEIACVWTQPPARRGRGKQLTCSAVHERANALSLPVRTPASMRNPDEAAALRALNVDALVVVAYGQILPAEVLDAARLGNFNLHASLLPRWRGAAPIQRAIMAGDAVTGVQVMRMTPGLDEGPVLSSHTTAIDTGDTAASLHDRLSAAGARLLVDTLPRIATGEATQTPQAQDAATYAKKITANEARIDWSRPAVEIDRHIRGLSPFPGAWFLWEGKRIKALLSRVEPGVGAPGEILDERLLIACGGGAVRLLRAQREGRSVQDAAEFVRGQPVPVGAKAS